MYRRSEGFFSGYLDARLFFQRWEVANPKGLLVITHGQGEHSECYHRLVEALTNENWSIVAWDWRGHGRSEGSRGYASHFNDYCHDYECFLRLLQKDPIGQGKPTVILGHSMGALIQLKTLLSHPKWSFSGQILSAPFLGLAIQVPPLKNLAAQVLLSTVPKITLWNEITNEMLSRDPQVIAEYTRDPLRHDRISSGVYLGALQAMDYVSVRADKLQLPTFLQMSDADPIASTSAAQKFFEKIGTEKKSLVIYQGRKHEIYNDLGREEVFADLKKYLNAFLIP